MALPLPVRGVCASAKLRPFILFNFPLPKTFFGDVRIKFFNDKNEDIAQVVLAKIIKLVNYP